MKKNSRKKQEIGTVISDRMDKTIIVRVERITKHPVYKRIIKSHTKFKVHDKDNQAKIGDKVLIVEGRPLSKEKCWKLKEILENEK